VKAHVLLDHDDYLPAYVLLTEAQRSDVKLANSFALNPGSIVALDRGYIDYALFGRWTMAGVFFVTPLKNNAAFAIQAEFATPTNRNIRADQIIHLTGVQAQTDCPPSAPHRSLGCRSGARNRPAHKPAGFWGHHDCRHLQRALANRAVFQGAEAEPDRKDLRRKQRKRLAHPDLDSLDRPSVAQMDTGGRNRIPHPHMRNAQR